MSNRAELNEKMRIVSLQQQCNRVYVIYVLLRGPDLIQSAAAWHVGRQRVNVQWATKTTCSNASLCSAMKEIATKRLRNALQFLC